MPPPKKTQNSSNLWKSIKPHQSARHFENEVIKFHSNHKTPIRHFPYVLGKRINLRKLYISVIKRGGYKKVNEKEVWEDILSELNLPKEGTNCELAIQTIYHRYLEAYERNQWNCLSSGALIDANFDNDIDLDIDLSKHSALISDLTMRDRSVLASFVHENTPKIYSDYQHIISNTTRSEFGLSCDLKDGVELKHLTMSLKSGLCNEIDLALNTLLIMSNNDRLSPDLRFTGDLIELVVATTGIVDIKPGSYYENFKDYLWMNESLKFWNKTIEDGVGRMFLVPNIFSCSKSDIPQIQRNCNTTCYNESYGLFNDDHLYHQTIDPCCQRIYLVSTIVHNLVLNSQCNSKTIVSNNQALRFIFLGAHSKDSTLRQLSLHTLTRLRFVLFPIQDSSVTGLNTSLYTTESYNITNNNNERNEESDQQWFTEFLLDFLMTLLSSDNRSDRISAFEIIQSLCFIEDNHEILSKQLQCSFITRISSQLYVPDIHPLCCALETLISLSHLGEDMCRRMAMCNYLLKCLLHFVSIEAQMFGPLAVYKIKTFNSRPPIPASSYHSLPQINRLPVQSTLRPLAPFNPSGSSIPYFNQNLIRFHSNNSISPHSLSKALTDPIVYPIDNKIPNMSQLTPLQHIDNLLTKSIASFAVTDQDLTVAQPMNSVAENFQLYNKEENSKNPEMLKEKCKKDTPLKERKIIQIKCCVDDVDLDIEEINGTIRLDRDTTQNTTVVNGTINDNIINGSTKVEEDSSIEAINIDKEEQIFFSNGSLEVDVSTEDEDPDRRQMPPPSLPTPSMLKKQMRPKSVHNTITNGYVSQTNCKEKFDTNVSTKDEERREQVKKWLKENYKITEDKALFVTKQKLVEKLQNDLFDFDETYEVISAHDLHVCMKEIFGVKVQVKVEHGVNGSTQLIYNNLGPATFESTEKCALNGVSEMNGFISHSVKRKKSVEDAGDIGEFKKFCEDKLIGNERNGIDDESITKVTNDFSTALSKTSAANVLIIKKNFKDRKRTQIKVRRRPKWSKYKSIKSCKIRLPSTYKSKTMTKENHIVPFIPEDRISRNIPSYSLMPHVACLWNVCTERFFDYTSLQTHITTDHLSQLAYDVSCSQRIQCQWQECPSSHVPRASLSLLSHVVQEHCTMSYPLSNIPQFNPMIHPNVLSNSSVNSAPFNTMMTPNVHNINIVNNHVHEKSGWSVLYDHFRMDEQCQPNLPEGPITKHIRISSSIILRNMSRHSIIAKDFLRTHEKYLTTVALSNQDCSSVIVQCLDELRGASSGVDDHML